MGYWIEDDSGYLGDFASISGLKEFRVWAEGVGGAVGSFVDQGMTENPSGLADALDQQKAEGDVEDLRKELLEMARGADGALVLTDGSDGDDEEDDGQEASAEEAMELGGGNPYHAKDGKFATAGGMKGQPAGDKKAASREKAINGMSAEMMTAALPIVTGRYDYKATIKGGYKQIEKETGHLSFESVRATTWVKALALATKKWGMKR